MRLALKAGTGGIIVRLKAMIETGVADASLRVLDSPADVAAGLYHQWLGASVMVKITRTHDAFETALQSTRRMLGIAGR